MEEAITDRTGETMADRYQITGPLGGGAMAEVYRGLDLRHDTDVAIKILKDEVKDRSSFRDRFEREVLITSKVNHPCCIHKLDFGVRDDELPYQVMELVPGRSLADLLDEQEMLPPARALHIFSQLLQALSVCSDAGIIHRDVKPENILIFDRDGETDCLKLIDFGIAKLIGEAAEGHEKLTSVGLILGTPHYIAPEWVTDENVDPRADLYSASVLLFEMLTSAPPFLSEDRRELMKKHLREPPPTLRERAPQGDFSDALEAMVKKGLAKDPDDRFRDAHEYLQALQALSGKKTQPQPHIATLPPAGFGPQDPVTGGGMQRGLTLPPVQRVRRISPLMIGGGLLVLVAGLVTLTMLDGDSTEPTAGVAQDAGSTEASVVFDAAIAVKPDPPPVEVVPISDAQIAPALAAWKEAGLEATDFSKKLDDEQANGACRAGKVESIRALLCVTQFDPVTSSKPMRRKLPGERKPRKWRARIKRGDIQLRVESVRKKKKRTRRKIESAFKGLPK
jgi:serine/threonine protein kinase